MANRFTTATLEDDGVDQEWDGEDWKYMVRDNDDDERIMCVCDDLQTAHKIAKLLSEQSDSDEKA